MPRNYYVVLGITTSATAEEVHAAFRRRSKELHPDISGTESGPFIELQEAYAVLGDPAKRRDYDRQSTGRVEVRVRRPPRAFVAPLQRRRSDVVHQSQAAAKPLSAPRPVSILDDFQSFGPSFDELFDRLWSNFRPFTHPKGERSESLNIEVLATPAGALRGGRVCLALPARVECPTCGGRGLLAGFACWRCGGEGAFVMEQSIHVDYPAGLRDGHVVRVPLHRFGIGNFYLTVIFRVAAGEIDSP